MSLSLRSMPAYNRFWSAVLSIWPAIGGTQAGCISADNTAHTDRLRAEQIRLLYHSGPVGVIAAMVGAFVMASLLWHLGKTPVIAIVAWLSIVTIDVVFHLLLVRRYTTANPSGADWRKFATAFTAFALVEGCIWGVTALTLTRPDQLDQQLLVMCLVCAVTTGAVSAFGVYLPAFYALFLPATLPFVILGAMAGGLTGIVLPILVSVDIIGLIFVAHRHNDNLLEMLRLRFQNADLATALREQKDAAVAASFAKTRFLAAASHDLRQPVHALGLFVGALRACELDREAARLVDLIEDSVTALDGLFSALLDISRLDAGIVTPSPRVFAMQSMLDRLQRDYAGEAASRNLAFRVRPCSAIVSTDPVLLERILRNLVSNALRYTDRGGVLIACRAGRSLRIQVWDTGRGIPRSEAENVFQEFVQLHNPERDRAQGLGLGLAIVRRLAALLNHPVTLASRPGRGSVFGVSVPIATLLADHQASPEPGSAASGFILVVDDEIAIQDGMRTLLSSWGHTVLCAGSGNDLMAQLETNPRRPDLIVCDYRLRNNETGLHVVERLRTEYNHDIPALLITGDTAPDRLAEVGSTGLLLLHKPVANSRLRAAINNLLKQGAKEAGTPSAWPAHIPT